MRVGQGTGHGRRGGDEERGFAMDNHAGPLARGESRAGDGGGRESSHGRRIGVPRRLGGAAIVLVVGRRGHGIYPRTVCAGSQQRVKEEKASNI
jgi:hypothetical protein